MWSAIDISLASPTCGNKWRSCDWQLIVPFSHCPLTLLCCPEDRRCTSENKSSCMTRNTLCKDCEVPVCRHCEDSLLQPRGPEMPYAALTNDLMVFYSPLVMYEKQATAMELICASVCLTSMVCFTLGNIEAKGVCGMKLCTCCVTVTALVGT